MSHKTKMDGYPAAPSNVLPIPMKLKCFLSGKNETRNTQKLKNIPRFQMLWLFLHKEYQFVAVAIGNLRNLVLSHSIVHKQQK